MLCCCDELDSGSIKKQGSADGNWLTSSRTETTSYWEKQANLFTWIFFTRIGFYWGGSVRAAGSGFRYESSLIPSGKKIIKPPDVRSFIEVSTFTGIIRCLFPVDFPLQEFTVSWLLFLCFCVCFLVMLMDTTVLNPTVLLEKTVPSQTSFLFILFLQKWSKLSNISKMYPKQKCSKTFPVNVFLLLIILISLLH